MSLPRGMAAVITVALAAAAFAQSPLGTAFTYQGVLKQAGAPLNGNDLVDLQAVLYDAAAGGSQVGGAVVVSNVDFEQGRFTILLDFGLGPFGGEARWLQLLVRKPPGTGPWVTLTPRQPLTATPYGLFAVAALDADLLEAQPAAYYRNASNLNAGTLADGRLSSNVALLNAAQAFTANKYFTGNVGIGTTSPAYKLDVNGTLRAAGTTGPHLIIHDSNGSNDRPGIQFTNNSMHYICGDDVSDESFGVYSIFGNNRAFGAALTVHGPAAASWGNYIGLKHDGSDGFVYTDVGDLVLDPLGNVGIDQVNPTQKLDVNGTVKMTGFQLGTSTTAGYVLTADASGVGTWQQAAPGGGIGGSGSANCIPKFTGPTAIGNSVMAELNGNIGIGQSTPGYPLHFASTTGEKICFYGSPGGDNTGIGMTSAELRVHTQNNGGDIVFGYGSTAALTETLRIKGTGSVGIGDSTPDAKLDVNGPLRSGAAGMSENVWAQLDHAATNGPGMSMRAPTFPGQFGRANVCFDGDALRLLASLSDVDPPTTNGISIASNGFVGVGIAQPSTGNAAFQVLANSTTGYAMKAEATGATATGLFVMGGTSGQAADLRGTVRVFDRSSNDELVRVGAGGNGGAVVRLFDDNAHERIQLDALHGSTGGSALELWSHNNLRTVYIQSDEGGGAAEISLYNAANPPQRTIALDADYGGSGEGRVITDVLEITGGSDLSEQFDVSAGDQAPGPGMVVVIDPDRPGQLRLATTPYDRKVAGVISGANGVRPGLLMGQRESVADGQHPVALTGRVYCWCDASGGAIGPGDLLTTSGTPGHAMKVTDAARAAGAVLGKAMTALAAGERGLVLILVGLQ